jgi:drug/metabolite transporter (DMT)-like permease
MNKTKGIASAVLAAFIYGFTPILGKFSYLEGSNSFSLTFYRSLLSLPMLFIILKANKIPLSITKSEIKNLTVLGILGPALTALALYGAYDYISVGMTTTIHYIYPILVASACVILFKEKLSKEKLISLIFSTIGILLFFEGDFSGSIVGIIIALLSGIFYASFIVFMDKSGTKTMFPFKISFYTCIVSSILLFFFGIATKSIVINMSFLGWLYTFLVAVFVSVIANTLMAIAIKNVGSTVTAILGMFEPITSVILGIIFLNELLSFKNILGCTLILIAVLILTLSKDKKDDQNQKDKSISN